MTPRHLRLLLWIAPAICVNLLLVATIKTGPATNPLETIARQALGGTVFGQTAIAAAWAAFGPGRFMWRLPLSLAWVAITAGGMGINGVVYEGGLEFFVIAEMLLFAQWLLLQPPLWAVAIGYGVQLRHANEVELATRQAQFGIGELMLVTAIVAVLFGVGRIVVPPLLVQEGFLNQVGPILVFLVVAQTAITFPLVLAPLLRQRTCFGVIIALVLITLGTICEIPLIRMMNAGAAATPLELFAFNAGTVASMIVLLSIVRLNGYSLSRGQALAKE